MKAIIINLGNCVRTDSLKTVRAFKALGLSYWRMLWYWRALFQVIDSYKKGNLTDDSFREKVLAYFPRSLLTKEQFEKAWNAMCEVTPESTSIFTELDRLSKEGVAVRIISDTNSLQVKEIRSLILRSIPGEHWFSFEKKQMNLDLLKACIQDLKDNAHCKSSDIQMILRRPTFGVSSGWGWLNWLRAPIKTLLYRQQLGRYHLFSKAISDLGVSVVPIESMCDIVDKLKKENLGQSELNLEEGRKSVPVIFSGKEDAPPTSHYSLRSKDSSPKPAFK